MKKKSIIFLCALLSLIKTTAGIYYVLPGGSGSKSGTSWTDASDNLQVMLNTAAAGDEIWVGKGVYLPERSASDVTVVTPGSRTNAFVLKKDVRVYGGFSGTEMILGQRDSLTHLTVLSGDFNNDDVVSGVGATLSISGNSENAYHVVITTGDMGIALLNGCRILGGNANGTDTTNVGGYTIKHDFGGGIYNAQSSLPVKNCTIHGNTALHDGAGVYNESPSTVVMTNCKISDNRAGRRGGGIAHNTSVALSLPVYINCLIAVNRADSAGGAIFTGGNVAASFADCTFSGNAASRGGAIYDSAGSGGFSTCTITDNVAMDAYGGGLYNDGGESVYLRCIFNANAAPVKGGAVYNAGPSLFKADTFRANSAPYGGAIYNEQSLQLEGCVLRANTGVFGAGIFDFKNGTQLKNCTISSNVADSAGGGIYAYYPPVSYTISGCKIDSNRLISTSGAGAGLYLINNTTLPKISLVNCSMNNNLALSLGGAIYNEGCAVAITNSSFLNNFGGSGGAIMTWKAPMQLTNCNISKNAAAGGGSALYSVGMTGIAPVTLTNCTISGNRASYPSGTIVQIERDTISINNCIVWGNNGGISDSHPGACIIRQYSLVQDETGGTAGNIDGSVNPLLVDTAAGDYSLQSGSPVINKGSNALYPGFLATDKDLANKPRQHAASRIDLGAYEYQGAVAGIGDPALAGKRIQVYPNPAAGGTAVTIVCDLDAAALQGAILQVLDVTGKVLSIMSVDGPTARVALPQAEGVYYITLLQPDGQKYSLPVSVKG
jgi:hypothetical protein